jgi:hypothetical protein
MHSKHTAGVTESLKDSFDIFLILAGEIPPTWVRFVQNKYLIGCISNREGENTPFVLIDLSEYGHFFFVFSAFDNSSHSYSHFSVLLSGLFVFLPFAMLINCGDTLSIVETRRMTKTVPSSPWRYLCYECILSSV